MDVEQLGSLPGVLRFQRRTVLHARQRNTQFLRYQPHRLRKGDVLDFLDKAEYVAGNSAAKAVKELPSGVDGKRWRLLLMKWTKSGKILRPGFLQLHVIADHADDIRLRLYEFLEICGV